MRKSEKRKRKKKFGKKMSENMFVEVRRRNSIEKEVSVYLNTRSYDDLMEMSFFGNTNKTNDDVMG